MRNALLAFSFFILTGCTTVHIPNYIKSELNYQRKVYGDFDQIVSSVRSVLAKEGWKIENEIHPSVFERTESEDSKGILIFTGVKQHSMFLYSSYTHLNVFVHAIAEGATVEIRFHKVTPLLIKQFRSNRNDKLANRLLDKIEKEAETR